MGLFHSLLSNELQQIAYNKNFVVFGLPPFARTFDEVIGQVKSISGYRFSSLQYRLLGRSNNYLVSTLSTFGKGGAKSETTRSESVQSTRKGISLAPPFPKVDKVDKVSKMRESVFTVKPDIQNDIYHLYEEGDKYHAVALIPDYKTSVMMNKLFRNIKENANLDALEESDNEDEFEDERDDRFVFLDKSYKMVCVYNYKFKKWAPVRLLHH
jgi:hypothetical protein